MPSSSTSSPVSSAQSQANMLGIILMCVAMGLGAGNDIIVKLLSDTLSVAQILALRGLFVCGLSLVWVIAAGYGRALKQLKNPLVILRSSLEAISAVTFFLALAHMPIGELSAVFLITPLLIAAGAALIYKEQISLAGWGAIAAGFIGMLLVVKPGTDNFTAFAFYGVASAVATAARDLLTRKIKSEVSSLVVCFSAGLANMLLGVAMTVVQWGITPLTVSEISTPTLWLGLALAAVVVTLANYGVILAFRQSKASVVSPFRYSSLLWAMLAGFIVWKDMPDAVALLGSVLIIGSGLFILQNERKAQRRLRNAVAV